MKDYITVSDISNVEAFAKEAISLKEHPFKDVHLGKNKTIGLLFFNPSLRTRLSTQKAAQNLGLNTMVMNFGSEGWQLEYGEGIVMDQGTSEHIKEAAQVISQYCDIIAIRAFATFEDRADDYSEKVLRSFQKYASVPIVNMESAAGHPLQALTDVMTVLEHKKVDRPKVVLTWAPHPKALPQAVANSVVSFMKNTSFDFSVVCPEEYMLAPDIIDGVKVVHNQEEAFENADFIIAKNWSAYNDYGKVLRTDKQWQVTLDKFKNTAQDAKFMHCLPVRRNVVVADEVLDSDRSIVIQQANNRTFAAQQVLKTIIEQS